VSLWRKRKKKADVRIDDNLEEEGERKKMKRSLLFFFCRREIGDN